MRSVNYQSIALQLGSFVFFLNILFFSSLLRAQGGMVALPSFGDPPKKPPPAQPASAQPTPPAPAPAQTPTPARSAPQASPSAPPPVQNPPTIQRTIPTPTAQPLPPPTAQPLPPPTAQPLPTVDVKNELSNCSRGNVLSVLRKAFEPNPPIGKDGRRIENITDFINQDGKTVQSGIEVCKQEGLQTFSDAIKTSYKREISDGRGAYFREVNPGPLRGQFRNLINQERTEIFRAEEERRKQDELRAAEERRKQDELRAAEERRKRESISKRVVLENPKVQAVYFIDGTKSAYKQRNLFHQMSRAVNPINTSSPTAKGYLRILSGISTINAAGIEDLYALAARTILEDITNNGVNEIYILGFSRGAILALNLTKDLCGEGATTIKVWSHFGSIIDRPVQNFGSICEKIKAVVLVDPVNTSIALNWSSTASEKLKPNTINIFKKAQNEWVLTTAQISNITHAEAIPDLDHGGMMCGKKTGWFSEGPYKAADSNLKAVRHHVVSFLQQRGLKINWFDLQDCFDFDGAWPPCVYRPELQPALTCSRDEYLSNWELNTW